MMPPPRRTTVRPRTPRLAAVGAAVAAVGLAFLVALSLAGGVDRDDRSTQAYTGELSSMNLPVIETPGAGSGTTRVAGIVVTGSSWALGNVALDTAVIPRWVLRNEGPDAVTFGEPYPLVRAGCCPGPITLSHRTLQPGDEAILAFELAMHAGMDGWHELAVHVPIITTGDERTTLEVDVTGHFGGG
jgi:hypothetical protein